MDATEQQVRRIGPTQCGVQLVYQLLTGVIIPTSGGIAVRRVCWRVGVCSFVSVFMCSLSCAGAKYPENDWRQRLGYNGAPMSYNKLHYGESNGRVLDNVT